VYLFSVSFSSSYSFVLGLHFGLLQITSRCFMPRRWLQDIARGFNPGTGVWTFERVICAPKGLKASAQGFNPGNRPAERRALNGRQIECTNTVEMRLDSRMSRSRTLIFAQQKVRNSSRSLSPLQGEPLIRVPRVETLG
jgi:hypothetical protein